MGDESRNFRYYYYDKVGFRGVDEKKSLEMILKDKPVDLNKLSQFCQRFTLPSLYRDQVWKLLLGIASIYPQMQDTIAIDRLEQAAALKQSLRLMQEIDDMTLQPIVIVKMIYLDNGKLCQARQHLNKEYLGTKSHIEDTLAIASMFTKLYPSSESDAFWMTRNFTRLVKSIEHHFPSLVEATEQLMKLEDIEVHNYLIKMDMYPHLPLSTWFMRAFSHLLNQHNVVRIWDKLIGGGYKILAFTAASLIMKLRWTLLTLNNREDALAFLEKVVVENIEPVVNNCLEMWQRLQIDPRPNRQLIF